ncbi:MAG: hypothetical protein QOG55_640 [Acidobacteriaceae bacterium]|nr:hypothetical protein [Acidobacteriaceae bacterium]
MIGSAAAELKVFAGAFNAQTLARYGSIITANHSKYDFAAIARPAMVNFSSPLPETKEFNPGSQNTSSLLPLRRWIIAVSGMIGGPSAEPLLQSRVIHTYIFFNAT